MYVRNKVFKQAEMPRSTTVRGQQLMEYLHRQGRGSEAVSGPVVGTAFKGKEEGPGGFLQCWSIVSENRECFSVKKHLDLKFSYKPSHGTGKQECEQNEKQ